MKNKVIDFYSRLSLRERMGLIGAILVLSVLLIDRAVIEPFYHRAVILERTIHQEETAFKKSLRLLVQKDRIMEESRKYADYLGKAVTPEEEMAIFLKEIERVANQSSVSFLYIKPDNPKKESEIKKYFVNLACEAPMEQIVIFFHNIENSEKLLRIEHYTIQPQNKESNIAKCVMTISESIIR